MLYTRPMKSSEIARELGKPSKYVSSYLSYWKARGFVEYRAGYWILTQKGEEYVKLLIQSRMLAEEGQLSHKETSERDCETMNDYRGLKEASIISDLQQFIAGESGSKRGEQTTEERVRRALSCLEKVMKNRNLIEEEYYVLQHLVKHYAEWGSTYMYADQIAEELHYDLRDLMIILRKLQSKKLIYIYNDRKFGLRVGLSKGLKQLIDACLR